MNGPRSKQEKSKIDYSLGLVLPGECQGLTKDIQSIFVEVKEKSCNHQQHSKPVLMT